MQQKRLRVFDKTQYRQVDSGCEASDNRVKMHFLFLPAALIAAQLWAGSPRIDGPVVSVLRVPEDGLQPQVVEKDGVVHLLYFTGDAAGGDLSYVRSRDYGRTFSKPLRVNSEPGSAMAMGNIRGGQIALGAKGRVHIAWIGSRNAQPRGVSGSAPVLYTRLNDAGTAFEPQLSVSDLSRGPDGGTLAADSFNNVYVFWHAQPPGGKDEGDRRLWMAKSVNGGRNFAKETVVFGEGTGVCGCCGARALASPNGSLYVLFRSASQVVHRDIWLLSSVDGGSFFRGSDISQWNVGACVMSSAALLSSPKGVLAGWEAEKQIYFGRLLADTNKVVAQVGAPGMGNNRKYPALASNARGETLLVWTEDMAWKKGGSARWQSYDRDLQPEGAGGKAEGVPAWGLVAAFARADGTFAVIF
jgi:hypothetical protein